jgi:hypothetical protein
LYSVCVVRYRSLRQADPSSRGVLPTVVCVWVWSSENKQPLHLPWVGRRGKDCETKLCTLKKSSTCILLGHLALIAEVWTCMRWSGRAKPNLHRWFRWLRASEYVALSFIDDRRCTFCQRHMNDFREPLPQLNDDKRNRLPILVPHLTRMSYDVKIHFRTVTFFCSIQFILHFIAEKQL